MKTNLSSACFLTLAGLVMPSIAQCDTFVVTDGDFADGVYEFRYYSKSQTTTVNGVQIYDWAEPDGTEWLFEGRFYFAFHASSTNTSVAFGAFCPKTEHSDATTEQGFGYGDTAKAGVYWQKAGLIPMNAKERGEVIAAIDARKGMGMN